MRKTLIVASLALAAVGSFGCAERASVRRVDQSVLPAQAKALLVQDARLDEVEEVTLAKGTRLYRMHYTTGDGMKGIINYNPATETEPTAVFGTLMR